MNLLQTLEKAAASLKSGKLMIEAQVKQHVILPVFDALGWDHADPESVFPEYSVAHGRVDYALLGYGQALAFIEAKREGAIDQGGEEQLFNYASNQGIPLLVLSDGNRWDFYLSMAEGVPAKRCFHRLELRRESSLTETAEFLQAHLSRDAVVSGAARRRADALLLDKRARARSRDAIGVVWRRMLSEPGEIIRDLLAEEVEDYCGAKPHLADVEAFLKNFKAGDVPSAIPVRPSVGELAPPAPRMPRGSHRRDLMIAGKSFLGLNKRKLMYCLVAEILAENVENIEGIRKVFPTSSRLREFSGALTSDEVKTVLRDSTRSRRTDQRYFCEEGELFFAKGNTFALTNQWGRSADDDAKALANELPHLEIKIQVSN